MCGRVWCWGVENVVNWNKFWDIVYLVLFVVKDIECGEDVGGKGGVVGGWIGVGGVR